MSNWIDLLAFATTTFGVSVGGAWLMSTKIVDYRLNIEFERKKNELQKELDVFSGESAAQRGYEYAAKKRLYEAIGPLRFQLLIACRDFAKHINGLRFKDNRYSFAIPGYFGISSLYRLLLPLVIVDLIEKQIGIADFAVDDDAIRLLKFKDASFKALKGAEPLLEFPDVNWDSQEQHLVHHTISTIIRSMQITDGDKYRPMEFHEFEDLVRKSDDLTPIVQIFNRFNFHNSAVFWLRLVCMANICAELVNHLGLGVGFSEITMCNQDLLTISSNSYINDHISRYEKQFSIMLNEGL